MRIRGTLQPNLFVQFYNQVPLSISEPGNQVKKHFPQLQLPELKKSGRDELI
jgi:hypothetical protein